MGISQKHVELISKLPTQFYTDDLYDCESMKFIIARKIVKCLFKYVYLKLSLKKTYSFKFYIIIILNNMLNCHFRLLRPTTCHFVIFYRNIPEHTGTPS